MNSKINRVIQEIEKAQTKIAELQILLPELERKKVELENEEIIRRVRKASISDRSEDLENVLAAIRKPSKSAAAAPVVKEVAVNEFSNDDEIQSEEREEDETQYPTGDEAEDKNEANEVNEALENDISEDDDEAQQEYEPPYGTHVY